MLISCLAHDVAAALRLVAVCMRRTEMRSALRVVAFSLGLFASGVSRIDAQTFISGSDGSDGPYMPSGQQGTVVIFDPSQFGGSRVASNVFNFTSIVIPQGVTVKLSGN